MKLATMGTQSPSRRSLGAGHHGDVERHGRSVTPDVDPHGLAGAVAPEEAPRELGPVVFDTSPVDGDDDVADAQPGPVALPAEVEVLSSKASRRAWWGSAST
jgi:hypothetical protein